VWLTGAVVCLLAAPEMQLFADAGNEWLHSALLVSLAHANQLPLSRL